MKEQKINELIEKEKEIRTITLQKDKEEKKQENNKNDLQKQQNHQIRKQKYEEMFKNLQELKDDIYRLRSYTGFSDTQSEISDSLTKFKSN